MTCNISMCTYHSNESPTVGLLYNLFSYVYLSFKNYSFVINLSRFILKRYDLKKERLAGNPLP